MAMRMGINNIHVSYGGRDILRDCSFEFSEPGIYMITGDNGSGKSTLLRVCALLESPGAGAVEFYDNARPLTKDLALRRRLTLVLPRSGLFNATVYDNVTYGLKLRGMPPGAMRQRAAEALDFVGLSRRGKQNALTLSSGEAQRLAMARAMIIEPEILLMDEPTASVDKANIALIEDIILKLSKDRRIIIMSSHDEGQAARLGDRILRLSEGALMDVAAQST